MTQRRQRGFTLVEVLIVVVIMAVLAATIIPQFADSTKDAKVSTAKFNLHTLRSQIELYKSQHDGKTPSATLTELINATDVQGNTSGSGPFPYGPYIREIPPNPFNNSTTVAAPAAVPPTATVTGAGWLYDPTSGGIWLNDADHLSE